MCTVSLHDESPAMKNPDHEASNSSADHLLDERNRWPLYGVIFLAAVVYAIIDALLHPPMWLGLSAFFALCGLGCWLVLRRPLGGPTQTKMSRVTVLVATAASVVGVVGLYLLPPKFEPYQMARDTVLAQPQVQKDFGSPLTAGLRFLDWAWHEDECCGSADFALNVTGANGSGTAYVDLKKERGEWRVVSWRVVRR